MSLQQENPAREITPDRIVGTSNIDSSPISFSGGLVLTAKNVQADHFRVCTAALFPSSGYCTAALGSAAAIGRAALFPSVLLAEQHNLGGERRARSGL